ncbi:MAG: hypothetical protein WB761_22490 [Solirubrobacteraceae bacterium]
MTGDYALVLLGLLCRQDRARHAWSDPRGCRNRPVIVLTVRAAVEQKGVSTEALSQAGFPGLIERCGRFLCVVRGFWGGCWVRGF